MSLCWLPRSRSTRATTWFWFPPVLATVLKLLIVPDGVTTPGPFAAAHRLRSALDVRLMRLTGMTLPLNAVGVAVPPGHAPRLLNAPAQGCIIVGFISANSPLQF